MSNSVWRLTLFDQEDPEYRYDYLFSSKEKAMEYAGKCYTDDDGYEYCFYKEPYEAPLDTTFPYKKFY